MDLLRHFEKQQIKGAQRPKLQTGDIVRVVTKIEEGDKSRLQTFEGTVLGIRGSGPSTTFTVRRQTGGFGVERIFPLYNPIITAIEIVKRQKVRRAKLTYLRQEGRRRFKEDVKSMQRLVKEEEKKKRLAEERAKKEAAEKEAKAKEEEKKDDEPKDKDEVIAKQPAEAKPGDNRPAETSEKINKEPAKKDESN